MELEKFKNYTKNLRHYTGEDIDKFEFLTDEEIENYQDEIERNDGDNLSPWDHIRAFITMKSKIVTN